MISKKFDILCIGNAIVDVISLCDEAFLSKHQMKKGSMQLINAEAARELYAAMPDGIEQSGGSAANTAAVASSLGARTAFLGKVADDKLGDVFSQDLRKIGVTFPSKPLKDQAPTARCLINVTPDGQRTMHTFLGASVAFAKEDIIPEMIAESQVLYLEGYLFDPPAAQEAFRTAAGLAAQYGTKVALSLSDPFCIERHRRTFLDFINNGVDLLFANEAEICSLFEVNDFEAAVEAVRTKVPFAALTKSEQGSVIVRRSANLITIPAFPTEVIDTTGAGDAYAAGFLTGYTQGESVAVCGKMGSLAASEIISHVGARPERNLKAEVDCLRTTACENHPALHTEFLNA